MARKVYEAFSEFMNEIVNLDPEVVSKARDSRDKLLENIKEFDDGDFFRLYPGIDIQFGSFARKTKKRPLDDIDLMIGIAADGATYNEYDPWNNVHVNASKENSLQQDCLNDDGITLNSTKVLNRFKSKLSNLRDYSRSEIHKNGEAITLNLKSKEWAFDIVPCFRTVFEAGRRYYLIPNGDGGWKKTDPKEDQKFVKDVNEKHNGYVLPLVRLCKKWFEVKKFETPMSYLVESMIVRYCASMTSLDLRIRIQFTSFLQYLMSSASKPVYDMKNIEGDINYLDEDDCFSICQRAKEDYKKAVEANYLELKYGLHEKAINLWREIFGQEFPTYG